MGRGLWFISVPSHVGIRGNSAADSAAKDALTGDISVELIPFSVLILCANKYTLELWQSEWDEFLKNKIFPALKECIVCPWTNRKKETVIAQLHIGCSWSLIHFYWWVSNRQHALDVMIFFLHIEHILRTYSDLIEMRENHFTAQSVHVLSDFFLVEQTFNYLKAKYF